MLCVHNNLMIFNSLFLLIFAIDFTVNEQSESISDCSLHSSIASLASGRAWYLNLFLYACLLCLDIKFVTEAIWLLVLFDYLQKKNISF